MMTQKGLKYVVINTNVSNLCYHLHLNCCVDGYKYTVLNDTHQDATRYQETTSESRLRRLGV
jgi:hypothetical protein